MGQRLTIRIYQNQKQEQPLATLYYHWSAYTVSALEELKTFYKNYSRYLSIQKSYQKVKQDHPIRHIVEKTTNDLEQILIAIYQAVLEEDGGFPSREYKKATQLYPVLKTYADPNRLADRSYGLVAFSEEEQNGLYHWSEGNIDLYLDEQEFRFDVYSSYNVDDLREYLDDVIRNWFGTESIDKITDQQIIEYCTEHLPKFDDIEYHKIDDIDVLITLFEQHDVFYDADEEMVIFKIW